MLCHFIKQFLQQHPVACWTLNIGCPCHGVCLPSFLISAGAHLVFTTSLACFLIVAIRLLFIYSLSALDRWNELRNFDWANLSKKASISWCGSNTASPFLSFSSSCLSFPKIFPSTNFSFISQMLYKPLMSYLRLLFNLYPNPFIKFFGFLNLLSW